MKKSAAKKTKSLLLSDIICLAHDNLQAGESISRKDAEFCASSCLGYNIASARELKMPVNLLKTHVQYKSELQTRRSMQAILSLAKGTA